MKKVLAIALAVLMVFGLMPMALAADWTTNAPTLTVSATGPDDNDIIAVTINVSESDLIGTYTFALTYDSDLVSVDEASGTYKTGGRNSKTIGLTLESDDPYFEASSNFSYNHNRKNATSGEKIFIITDANSDGISEKGLKATMFFKVSEAALAAGGQVDFALTNEVVDGVGLFRLANTDNDALPFPNSGTTASVILPVGALPLTGSLTTPAKGATDTSNIAAADATLADVTTTWSPALVADPTGAAQFAANTEYTATVTVKLKDGVTLKEGVVPTGVEGLTFTQSGTDFVATKTFPRTADKSVTGLTVTTNPTKMLYEAGDTLDKTGMVLTATYDDNSTENVADKADITYASGTALQKDDTAVTLSYGGQTVRLTGLTVTAKFEEAAFTIDTADKDYTGAAIEPSVTSTEFAAADYTVSYDANTNAGTAKITVTANDTLAAAGQKIEKTFTIKPVALTMAATVADKAYDGTTDAVITAGALTGVLGTDDVSVAETTVAGKFADANVGAGKAVTADAEFTLTGAAAANYTLTQPTGLTASITKAAATDEALNAECKYAETGTLDISAAIKEGSAAGALTVTADASSILSETPAVTGTTLNYKLVDDKTLVDSTATVTIPVTGTNYADYNIVVTIKMIDKPSQVIAAEDVTMTFGETGKAVAATVTTGDGTVSYATTDTDVITIDATSGAITALKVGTATVTVTASGTTDYAVTTKTVTVTVSKKQVTAPTADATVFTYNGAVQTYAVAASDDYTVTGNTETNAGDYTVTVALKDAANTEWADGTTADKTFDFAIAKATITVNVASKTIELGGALPNISAPVEGTDYTVTGLASGETLGGTLALAFQQGGSDVTPAATKEGTYDIVASGATEPSTTNYNAIVYNKGTLSIVAPADDDPVPSGGGGSTPSTPSQPGTTGIAFVDIAEGAYYYDAVKWAVEKDVTKGTDETHFSPDLPTSRAQFVTFLWRAAGSPKATVTSVPFTDAVEGAYYYDALLWAHETGVTLGISETLFGVNETVQREQVVTFLCRFAKGSASGETAFTDVVKDAYYYDAVIWATAKGITNGVSADLFGVGQGCLRSQCMTFLYRYFEEA